MGFFTEKRDRESLEARRADLEKEAERVTGELEQMRRDAATALAAGDERQADEAEAGIAALRERSAGLRAAQEMVEVELKQLAESEAAEEKKRLVDHAEELREQRRKVAGQLDTALASLGAAWSEFLEATASYEAAAAAAGLDGQMRLEVRRGLLRKALWRHAPALAKELQLTFSSSMHRGSAAFADLAPSSEINESAEPHPRPVLDDSGVHEVAELEL